MTEDRNDYEVGYGRPPLHSRFKPGQSGNPSGRTRGSKNLATIIRKAVNERVIVSENGRRRSISKLEAAVKQVVNKAASGDQKFNPLLLTLVQLVESQTDATDASGVPLSAAEREVIGSIAERASRNKPGGQDD